MASPGERQRAGKEASGVKLSKEGKRKRRRKSAAHAKFDGRKHTRTKAVKKGQRFRGRYPAGRVA